jgi:hypothetical protein
MTQGKPTWVGHNQSWMQHVQRSVPVEQPRAGNTVVAHARTDAAPIVARAIGVPRRMNREMRTRSGSTESRRCRAGRWGMLVDR